MTAIVPEARCDHCHQTRPLFTYGAQHHTCWTKTDQAACRWCQTGPATLLCTRCWDTESHLEIQSETTRIATLGAVR